MKRSDLEHILRAASAITLHREFVIIGSQAILGKYPEAPEELRISQEADIYPKSKPDDSILIDGAIGEGSLFHQTFGYYAHGVGVETAILPKDWEDRLVQVQNENTHGAIGWCLELHDLAASKLFAGREKDVEFVRNLIRHGFVDPTVLDSRLQNASVDPSHLTEARQILKKNLRTAPN